MPSLENDGSKRITISQIQYDGIQKCLTELAEKTKATALLLSDINGQLIAQKGDTKQINTIVLSALAASDFAATSEMAKLVGEKSRFRLLFHEGEVNNVYLTNVGDEHFLIVVFDASVTLGLIRAYTKKAVDVLLNIVKDSSNNGAENRIDMFDTEFGSLLNDAMNRTFKK